MAKIDDRMLALARVYSDGMYQTAQQQGQQDELLAELQELADLASRDEAFRNFISSPLIDVAERAKSLESLFRGKASDLLVDALQVLNRKGRLALLPAVAEAYRRGMLEVSRRVDVQVTTAVPLTDDLRAKIRSGIEQSLELEPVLQEHVDASLIGGMILQVGDRKVDTSVKTRLEQMGQNLLRRAAQEIQSRDHIAA